MAEAITIEVTTTRKVTIQIGAHEMADALNRFGYVDTKIAERFAVELAEEADSEAVVTVATTMLDTVDDLIRVGEAAQLVLDLRASEYGDD